MLARRVLALAFVAMAVIVVWVDLATSGGMPAMPPQLCESNEEEVGLAAAGPEIGALASDGRFTVAALFGRMNKGSLEDDKGTWSRAQFEGFLRAIHFEKTSVETAGWARFEGAIGRGIQVQVDVLGPEELPANDGGRAMGHAIASAMGDHELVYVNGHAMKGAIESLGQAKTYHSQDGDPQAYAILVLDTCWSTQHYSLGAIHAAAGVRRLSVVANDSESVTGSVASFTTLLAGLLDSLAESRQELPKGRSWSTRLQAMNRLAVTRSAERVALVPDLPYPRPERYRLATDCQHQRKKRD